MPSSTASSTNSSRNRNGHGAVVGTSLKKTTAEEKRRQMTERRYEYRDRLRKTKKSHLVTLKRRYKPQNHHHQQQQQQQTAATTATIASSSLLQLANVYMNQRNVSSLAALQTALADQTAAGAGDDSSASTLLLQQLQSQGCNNDDPAERLANTLAYSLSYNADASIQERLAASRVLTNLAAMSTTTSSNANNNNNVDVDDNYYQKQPPPRGWCHVLIHSQALPSLALALQNFAIQVNPSIMASDGPLCQLCLQCCWAVGNIAGDSQQARDAARATGIVPSLTVVLQKGMDISHQGICRNASWALSNLTRGVTTSGKEFCSCHPPLLTPTLLASVLLSPEQHVNTVVKQFWWTDVAMECAWILAFLTAKEDEVVAQLVEGTTTDNPSSIELTSLLHQHSSSSPAPQHVLVAALAHRLEEASRAVQSSNDAHANAALRMVVPCLRSIGNIATACQGHYVAMLLKETPILQSLQLLIQAGTDVGGDVAAVAVEALWTAGTLVCDAGLPNHASTTIACPFLLPILCHVIVNPSAKLDLRREAVSACWNAVAAPPNEEGDDASSSRPTRDAFLAQIAQVPGMVASLTELLTSVDTDATFASIQLLNAMLRRLQSSFPTVRLEFLQANGVDALEAVCDGASQAHAYGGGQDWSSSAQDECAEIAADLIDDLFPDDDVGDVDDAPLSMDDAMVLPSSFTFSPIVNPQQQQQQQVFDFSEPPTTQAAFPNTRPTSVGRGRGKPIPSWMMNSS